MREEISQYENVDDEPEPVISCVVQLTRKDYSRTYRRHFWRSLWWIVVFAPLVSFLPISRAAEFRYELQSGTYSAIGVALALYLASALFLALSIEICARSFSSHAIRKTPLALVPQTLTFSSEGLQSSSTASSGQVQWTAFRKAIETRYDFQLYLGPRRYVLLPCDRLQSVQQRDQLKKLLKRHLGIRAKFHA